MGKKYLQIIALSAIMGSLGDNSAVRAITCKNTTLQNSCINSGCFWNGKTCEDKVKCASLKNTECNQYKRQCSWNKTKCDSRVACKGFNNAKDDCKKYDSQCKWLGFTTKGLCLQRMRTSGFSEDSD